MTPAPVTPSDEEVVARMICANDCPLVESGAGCQCPEWKDYVGLAWANLRRYEFRRVKLWATRP